jgi:hypothetical protein
MMEREALQQMGERRRGEAEEPEGRPAAASRQFLRARHSKQQGPLFAGPLCFGSALGVRHLYKAASGLMGLFCLAPLSCIVVHP